MSNATLATRLRPRISLIVAALGTATVFVFLPPYPTLLLITIITAGIIALAFRLKNYVLTVFSGAFLVRIALITVDATVGILPTPPISSGHNRNAIELAIAWSHGQILGPLTEIITMRGLMAHLLAPFYVVIGQTPISGRVGISFFSLLVGYLIFQLARRVSDRRTSLIAATVVLFWPTILARSVVIQREIVIVVVLIGFLWTSVQWLDTISLPTVTIGILTIFAILILRKENLFLIAVMIGFVGLAKSREKPHYIAGTVLFSTPILAYFTLNFGQFTGFGTTLSPEAINAFAYGRAHGDAVYLVGLHYDTWLDIILYAPIKVLYFLYTPFPWQIRGVTELLVGGSAIALLAATTGVRRGMGMLQNKPYYLGLLLSYLLTGVVTYSIIEMNYGAAVRRRIQFVPILLLIAVIGLSNIELNVHWPDK
ncbi:hypothetical protein [Haloarcula sebkhae]|uniref:Uncharacterized protein n=1 Tax=Haloarcula sebkhae TaxID=932660 RepID=A0ACC6VK39_9EURY|nr:hypothetical protein [Haloarcula sebkhae]